MKIVPVAKYLLQKIVDTETWTVLVEEVKQEFE